MSSASANSWNDWRKVAIDPGPERRDHCPHITKTVPAAAPDTFITQIMRALKWHWNLLFLGAGAAFSVLSGRPDMMLPALLAGELAYLGFLGTNQRFQNVLRGQKLAEGADAAAAREAALSAARLRQLVDFLGQNDRSRFEALRQRSRDMTELQRSMQSDRSPAGDAGFKTQSLDKLLWMFLKLLHHKAGLERFLVSASGEKLRQEHTDAETNLQAARDRGAPERLIAPLEEKLKTIQERLTNFSQGEENLAVLMAEIDKTEQKINHLCEVGMTSRDGSDLSHQIDGVADSVKLSERALADLDLGNLFEDTEAPPPLVSNDSRLLEFR